MIVETSGTRLDIEQTSERLGIDWREFSIGEGERVHFAQPSRSAIALNRVRGAKASEIRGRLTANGKVFLVNRNGVIFHGGSSVDVGGLLATTSDITNGDFMAGRYRFTPPPGGGGRIVNEGRISVSEGGLVALVGPQVANAGVIEARLGRVVLGSGSAFTLDLYGDELVSFAVGEETARGLVEHSGEIEADGGRVWLTAGTAKGVVDGVINLSGVVRARTVSRRGGRIVLDAGGSGAVAVSGQMDATGGVGDKGGRIEVTGEQIRIGAGAKVDASGGSGGGTVLVGGDYQGGGSLRHARTTSIESNATIRSDATQQGDGGTVVVWSDERTEVNGTLSARGGPGGGDGGMVETSSAGELEFTVPADVSAAKGSGGMWLLDPQDIEIDRGKADTIEAALNGGGNVSIRTSEGGEGEGNISVDASITKSEGGDASLSLRAHNRIEVNQPIRSEAGKLGVKLEAGKEVNVRAGIETNGGGFTSRITGVKTPAPASDSDVQSEDTVVEASSDQSTDAQTTDEPQAVAGGGGDGTEDGSSQETGVATEDSLDSQAQDEKQGMGGSDPGDETTAGGGDEELVSEETSDPAVTGLEPTVPEPQAEPQSTSEAALRWVTVSDRVATRGGGISVDGGDSGVSLITGTLDSSNLEQGQKGGDIEVLGEHVVLAGEAELDASGDAGGGDIHIGGDYQGKGERGQAQTTTIGKDVTIRSDAVTEGDAGDVVVWSKGTTRYSGSISARGGAEGGAGGDVEVSGKENLGFWGTVDAGAPAGTPGSLLLDPDHLDVIDALAGDGDQDLNILCSSYPQDCYLPAEMVLTDPGDLGSGDWTAELLESFGIDPNPNTPLNTVSWGRLIQIAQALPKSIVLGAENNVTFKALNGTVSTRGSPTGDNRGWTITLPLAPPSGEVLRFYVKSNSGDIIFENPNDNLAVINQNGGMFFVAPNGDLRLGNLYSMGQLVQGVGLTGPPGDPKVFTSGWARGNVTLRAGGDITTGTINTRIRPGRLTDPVTGAPIPQDFAISDTAAFDPGIFDQTRGLYDPEDDIFNLPPTELFNPDFFTDPSRGGSIDIVSRHGGIHIRGRVYTGSGDFSATADGSFKAGIIDTGANRLIVHSPETGPNGSPNTLATGTVDITADKIAFDKINAGEVSLQARTYTTDAISGTVEFDMYRNSDFIGDRPESEGIAGRPASDPGLTIVVGDTPGGNCSGDCVDNLVFTLGDVADATAISLNTGYQLGAADARLFLDGTVDMNLNGEFNFSGGDDASETQHVPLALFPTAFLRVLAPNAFPIEVPLNRPAQSGAGPLDGGISAGSSLPIFTSSPGSPGPSLLPGTGSSPPQGVASGITFSSSADVERIRNEGKENDNAEDSGGCSGEGNLEWLEEGARSAARELDWGRRSGVGTDPEDTEDVFKPASCYFAG